ncbi:hypothetical protein [Comamonas odontotermitis]|uniref:hypothetical protein n=1 Tax=Comamonas odontotermitis TaxID=379895 RepID=UPI001CC54204|nr:hypothetical protein [Comamonas odontotermitis]UBB17771.1 hypothetical protein LAD35_03755 [Comamonas odontotermitis]
MAEQLSLAYRLFKMRRWAGAKWSTAARWACSLVWRNTRNEWAERRARLDRREEVERAARQRL